MKTFNQFKNEIEPKEEWNDVKDKYLWKIIKNFTPATPSRKTYFSSSIVTKNFNLIKNNIKYTIRIIENESFTNSKLRYEYKFLKSYLNNKIITKLTFEQFLKEIYPELYTEYIHESDLNQIGLL